MRAARLLAFTLLLFAPALASAQAQRDRFNAGGYFRVMTRPDFQGGNSRLGFWNLYGRLLNEGPYGALELRYEVLQAAQNSDEVWASVHTKIEGGSFANTDPGLGALGNFKASQLYVRAGNIVLDKVTWQIGTLESYFGDLGLYDMRPSTLFNDMVGISGRYRNGPLEILLAAGDAGWAVRRENYSTIFSGGGTVKLHLGGHFEIGGGGQYGYEPAVPGNRFGPYTTVGVNYEDYLRHEVVQRFLEQNPGREDQFTLPTPKTSKDYRLIGYLGFGNLGPLRWSSLYARFERRHPEATYSESYQGRTYTVYLGDLTDERYEFTTGNEMQFVLWPEHLDAAWAVLYGKDFNPDNAVAPGDDNRTFYSTVLRLQYYLTRTVHLLAEGALAKEISTNGNLYREHADSMFANTKGTPDTRGFEFGDTNQRNTFQAKAGVVLNPSGPGIYTRPSLRLLYGLQYSSAQAAFGNGFVDSLDQYNVFQSPERHWHSVVAVEAEAWF